MPIDTCNDFSNEIGRTGFLWLAKKHSYFFSRKAQLIPGICFSFGPENGKHMHTLAEEKLE